MHYLRLDWEDGKGLLGRHLWHLDELTKVMRNRKIYVYIYSDVFRILTYQLFISTLAHIIS